MIAVRLGCRASFLPAARYVFQEWSVDVGEPIRFVGDDEQADVAYGADVHADDEFAAALERGQLVAPVRPGTTRSSEEPTASLTTTGAPAAIASLTTTPHVSS